MLRSAKWLYALAALTLLAAAVLPALLADPAAAFDLATFGHAAATAPGRLMSRLHQLGGWKLATPASAAGALLCLGLLLVGKADRLYRMAATMLPISAATAQRARSARLARLGGLLVLTSAATALLLASAFAPPALRRVRAALRPPVAETAYAPSHAMDGSRVEAAESPAHGFVLFVESKPDAAEVRVNGVDLGLTPASSTLECEEGERIEIAVTRTGYVPLRYGATCKTNRLLHLRVPLRSRK